MLLVNNVIEVRHRPQGKRGGGGGNNQFFLFLNRNICCRYSRNCLKACIKISGIMSYWNDWTSSCDYQNM